MTVTPIRVPVASVQGTLALDLSPRHAPPELPELADAARGGRRGRRSTRASAAGSSSGCTGSSRRASRSSAATGPRASCCGGPPAGLRRPAPPGAPRGAGRRPPARASAGCSRSGRTWSACTPASSARGRRGQRAGALRRPVAGAGAALREAPRALARAPPWSSRSSARGGSALRANEQAERVTGRASPTAEGRGRDGRVETHRSEGTRLKPAAAPRWPRRSRAPARRPPRPRPPGRGWPAPRPRRGRRRPASAVSTTSRLRPSRSLVGSSASSTEARAASARATATRCCCPPESSSTRCPAHSSSPTTSSASRARVSASAGATPPSSSGTTMFSYAVSTAARPLPWGTSTIPRAAASGRPPTAAPSTWTVPRSGSSAPAISHSSVVLPAPEGPVTASTRPAGTASDSGATATTPP